MYKFAVHVFPLCGTGMLELDGLLSNSTSMSSQSSLESDKNSPKSEEPKMEQVRWKLLFLEDYFCPVSPLLKF